MDTYGAAAAAQPLDIINYQTRIHVLHTDDCGCIVDCTLSFDFTWAGLGTTSPGPA